MNISLVLSSGGARGLTHIGAIEALEANGFCITSIAGSSIGTLVGGIYAMGKLPEFKEWLLTLRARDVFSLMDFTWNGAGVMKGEKVLNKLKTFMPDVRIEDLPIPFAAVTTDIMHDEEVVFTQGSFYEAVRASIAIPAIFTPVKYKDNILIDGGVLNPLPINHVKRTTGDLLVVVNLNGRYPAPEMQGNKGNYSGYISLLQQAYFSMRCQLARMAIQHYHPDIIVDIPRNITGVWDYHKAGYLIESGKELAQQGIDAYQQRLKMLG
ncbi:patatin-like phospholipase family protein [Parapedobacter tibetensis]|uniref:patatin-like phospholipase family protein n=1 Tax=Parapedobacter tibetensis TaxID=2972951 RepID=UPI00214D9B40|nr:patatin-like phospholipase family protein [Parapedobacter tibetensis]